MAHDEASLVDELRAAFERRYPLGWCVKLHGGPFQPGLPDLLVAGERHAALVEAKWADDADFKRPLSEALTRKLTAKQALNLHDVGALDGPLRGRVLLGGAVEAPELPGGKATLALSADVCDVPALRGLTLMDVATYLLELKTGRGGTCPVSYAFAAQLRARGDEWHAGYLLCGTRYYGPIKASTDADKTFEGA